jgi:hypothetical protein
MSKIYDALKKLDADRLQAPVAAPRTPALDMVRFEQFMDLQRDLFASGDAQAPDRLVHAVGTFLGVDGAGLGLIEGGGYRVVATYGLGWQDETRRNGTSVETSELVAALSGGRPVVLNRLDGGAPVRDVVVPIRGAVSGGLHLVMPEGRERSDENIQMARALAGMLGLALANARRSAAG